VSLHGECSVCGHETINYVCGPCSIRRAEKAEVALNKVLLLLRKPGSPPPVPLEMEVEYWVREVRDEVARLLGLLKRARPYVQHAYDGGFVPELEAVVRDKLLSDIDKTLKEAGR
jgi:hypothetical protein